MSINSTEQQLNSSYTSAFPWHVHTFCVIGAIICVIGTLSNILIIGSTIQKGSSLRHKTNWLIFALALADLGSNLSSFQVTVYFWIGFTHWTRVQCFYGALTQIITITYESYLMFTVALDRLIMIKYPIRYYKCNAKKYLLKMILPGCCVVILSVVSGFLAASNEEKLMLCSLPQAFGGVSAGIWGLICLILCFLVTTLNIWSFIISRQQAVPLNANWSATAAKMQRLNRSIIFVSVVFVSTWFLAVVVAVSANIINPPPHIMAYIQYESGLFAFINFSVNGIIYGWRSVDYRKEYKKLVGFFNNATVVPVAALANNN